MMFGAKRTTAPLLGSMRLNAASPWRLRRRKRWRREVLGAFFPTVTPCTRLRSSFIDPASCSGSLHKSLRLKMTNKTIIVSQHTTLAGSHCVPTLDPPSAPPPPTHLGMPIKVSQCCFIVVISGGWNHLLCVATLLMCWWLLFVCVNRFFWRSCVCVCVFVECWVDHAPCFFFLFFLMQLNCVCSNRDAQTADMRSDLVEKKRKKSRSPRRQHSDDMNRFGNHNAMSFISRLTSFKKDTLPHFTIFFTLFLQIYFSMTTLLLWIKSPEALLLSVNQLHDFSTSWIRRCLTSVDAATERVCCIVRILDL